MSEHTNPVQDPELAALDRLVGTSKVTGGAEGMVTYRWLEGGRFLIQDVDLGQYGERITGIEVIGRERPFGSEEPSADIKSRFYGSSGDTLDYVYAVEDDLLTIWCGEKGSPAYFQGSFDAAGDVLAGAWSYPGGGGYESTATRVAPAGGYDPGHPAPRTSVTSGEAGRRVPSEAPVRLSALLLFVGDSRAGG